MATIKEILEALEERGLTQEEIAKGVGVAQPQISRWKEGAEPKRRNLDKLIKFAQKRGVMEPAEGLETQSVSIIGYVGAGSTIIYSEGQGPFGEARVPPKGARNHTVAVRVRGNSMAPQLEDGWIVYYEDRQEAPTDDMIGRTCIVGLRDGRVLVKKLHRGPAASTFILSSLEAGQPPITDAEVSWAARIRWIQPK